MEAAGLSTAIMLALAAVLWFLYFVPGWIRRREYLETERTATRLQRTVRIMAEAAELPAEVRLEASAREAARRERIRLAAERQEARRALREAEAAAAARAQLEETRRREAAARAVAAGAVALPAPRARLRRARRVAGVLLLGALAVAGVQLALMATTGIAPGAWAVLAGCAAAGLLSLALQRRIRERLRAIAPGAAARPAAPVELPLEAPAPRRAWTPVPLPRPRYLEHPDAAPVGPSLGAPTMDAAARLRIAAAAEAERQRREPEVAPLPSRPVAAPQRRPEPVPSRYAGMGMIDELGAAPDLDEVLRRRRRVG